MEITFSIDQLAEVAKKIVYENPKKVILFNGSMGAGKTTLIKELVKTLGVKQTATSPTFSLVNEYYISNTEIIYHFDVYRLKNESEALDFGIDEYLYSGNWCFIEWASKIPNLIPAEHSVISINILPDGKRNLILE